MKYITTKEHPIFKEGLNFDLSDSSYDLFAFSIEGISPKIFSAMKESDINKWDELGYIKEVEEKEFTKSDMIDCLHYSSVSTRDIAELDFNDWLKQRDK